MNTSMLDLASARWRVLTQRYGSAEDIPRLLAALATAENERARAELWFGIWATLCPDGAVFTAAYAAVPHVIGIVRDGSFAERVAAMHFAAQVETSRHIEGAPPIPDDLVAAYAAAIDSLPHTVLATIAHAWDARTARIMSAALLAGKHQPALAGAMLALSRNYE